MRSTAEVIDSTPSRIRDWYGRLVLPSPSGLPNARVLLVVPLVALAAFIVLVAFGISGSSTGVYWASFGGAVDPDLLAGTPRPIRSDEWLVQSSWIVSQAQQGFPLFNQTLPGGMDATIQNDLPVWEWSSLFRPHVWGFLALPLDQGMAVRWWLPALAVFVSGYLYVVTVLPRHPGAAVLLSAGVLLSPILQWWFLPTTMWPVAFAFATLTAVTWGLVSSRFWPRLVFAAISGYFAITMAMSIYVPFIVPAALVVALAVVFEVVHRLVGGMSLRAVLAGLLPLVSAALVALAVLGAWVITRWHTIEAVTGTVYPGERLAKTGTGDSLPDLVALIWGPFQRLLLNGNVSAVSVNQSEAAAPMLVAVFLLVPALVVALRAGRPARRWVRRIDWRLLGPISATVVGLMFIFLPNWDAIAHLLLIDRTTSARMRLLFLITSTVMIALLLRRIANSKRPAPWWSIAVAAVLTVAASIVVWAALRPDWSLSGIGISWMLVTAFLVATVVGVARGHAVIGAAALLAASVVIGWGVNPIYSGVFDLRETAAGEAVAAIAEDEPGARWVGIGGTVPTAVLVESGVTAYNGVQTYPPDEMWRSIDPSGRFAEEWNRLGNVSWIVGPGEPVVQNPVRDQVLVSFDSCSEFAAEHVDYVLSAAAIDQPCLASVGEYREGATVLRIYRVTRP